MVNVCHDTYSLDETIDQDPLSLNTETIWCNSMKVILQSCQHNSVTWKRPEPSTRQSEQAARSAVSSVRSVLSSAATASTVRSARQPVQQAGLPGKYYLISKEVDGNRVWCLAKYIFKNANLSKPISKK